MGSCLSSTTATNSSSIFPAPPEVLPDPPDDNKEVSPAQQQAVDLTRESKETFEAVTTRRRQLLATSTPPLLPTRILRLAESCNPDQLIINAGIVRRWLTVSDSSAVTEDKIDIKSTLPAFTNAQLIFCRRRRSCELFSVKYSCTMCSMGDVSMLKR